MGSILGNVDHEEAETLRLRKHTAEVNFRHDQLTLEHTVGQCRDNSKPHLAICVAVQYNLVAHRQVQHIGERVGVGEGGNDPIRQFPSQKVPRVLHLGCRLGERGTEGETVISNESVGHGNDARVGRPVEVQAAGIVPGPDTEPLEFDAIEEASFEIGQSEPIAAGSVGQVITHR